MPVIYFNNSTCSAYVNLHELVVIPGILEILLFLDKVDAEESENDEQQQQKKSRKDIGGQPSFASKFPETAEQVTLMKKLTEV